MESGLMPNILIVDDMVENLFLFGNILSHLKVNLILAQSGAEALLKLDSEDLALALLDIGMPGMDGIELAKIIQSRNDRETVPIIFITGHLKDELELDECYESGAVDFILKPFRNNILISKVKVFLDLYNQKQLIMESHHKLEETFKEHEMTVASLKRSEEMLNKSQMISHVGSWYLNMDVKEFYWSDELYRIFGLQRISKDENMWEAYAQAVHPDDRNKVYAALNASQQDGMARPMDYRVIHSDGTVRWVHAQGEINFEASGKVLSRQGIIQDFTEKRKNETALMESERLYQTLLNASPEGIIIMDTNGRITEISDIILEIFGAENKEEFLGKHFFDFLPADGIKKMKAILHKTQTEGLVQNVEFILHRLNQSQFICEISTTLIQESDGTPKAFMTIIHDVSQRKKVEQQLIRNERMVSLGEMAAAMAHEINQPLLSITLGIENLFLKIQQGKPVEEKYFHTKSEKIFDDISRIGRIIDHVRSFSKDRDDYMYSTFDPNESIKNATSMISEQFRHHGIGLSVKLDKKIVPVSGNTYKFEQVILNLLTNAKDAFEEKRKILKSDFPKNIEIKTVKKDKSIYIEVSDNGSGISPEDLNHIMLPFYTTKETGRGTGLGLSISFGIIKEMDGTIEVESEPGEGTTFKIVLPLLKELPKSKAL